MRCSFDLLGRVDHFVPLIELVLGAASPLGPLGLGTFVVAIVPLVIFAGRMRFRALLMPTIVLEVRNAYKSFVFLLVEAFVLGVLLVISVLPWRYSREAPALALAFLSQRLAAFLDGDLLAFVDFSVVRNSLCQTCQ